MGCNCGTKSDVEYRLTYQNRVITASGGGNWPSIQAAQAEVRRLGGGQIRAVRKTS